MSAAVIAIATIPPRDTLYAISRCLLWQGGAALWREWCLTLPDDIVRELVTHESTPAPGARDQAMKAAQ